MAVAAVILEVEEGHLGHSVSLLVRHRAAVVVQRMWQPLNTSSRETTTSTPPQPQRAAVVPSPPSQQESPTLLRGVVDAAGGQLTYDHVQLTVPSDIAGSAGSELSLLPIDRSSVPGAPTGFGMGATAYLIALTDLATGTPIYQPSSPLTLEYQTDQTEISLADGDLGRLRLATWSHNDWVAVSCSQIATGLTCAAPQPGLVSLIIAAASASVLDQPLANGWFFKEANGFNGAGETGFAVVDDADARGSGPRSSNWRS